jgi:hypothetical protein
MDTETPAAVFFQKKYAWANNWGRVVGFTPSEILILQRGKTPNAWLTTPIPAAEVLRVRVRQVRSLYLLFLGLGAAAIAVFVTYVGCTGEAYGPGIFTIPVVCALFAYFAIRFSMRLHISFDLGGKKQSYKSWPGSFQETVAAVPLLVKWADSMRIPIDVDITIPSRKEA